MANHDAKFVVRIELPDGEVLERDSSGAWQLRKPDGSVMRKLNDWTDTVLNAAILAGMTHVRGRKCLTR